MVDLKSNSRAKATAKEYRDGVISQISGEGEGCVFTSADNSRVASTVDDVAKDFEYGKASYAPDTKGNSEIEKFPEAHRHSFEHGNCPSSEVVGQTSSGLPTVAKIDKPSDKNKNIY